MNIEKKLEQHVRIYKSYDMLFGLKVQELKLHRYLTDDFNNNFELIIDSTLDSLQ